MSNTISHSELADLLLEAGHRHHQAYITTDGGDPEWPLWYAGYIQAKLWDRAGRLPSLSELVYLLVRADKEFAASGSDDSWPPFYAELLLAELGSAAAD